MDEVQDTERVANWEILMLKAANIPILAQGM